jgi:DNA recombination protein RmuC
MDGWLPEILGIFAGLIVGAVVSWLVASARFRDARSAAASTAAQASLSLQVELSAAKERALRVADLESQLTASSHALNAANERKAALTAELTAERENLVTLKIALQEAQSRLEAKSQEAAALSVEVAQLRNTLEGERNTSQEKLSLLVEAKQSLTDQFKALANEILEEKSKRFTEQNQSNLGALLDPLKLKINEFQSKIEDNYIKEGKDRTALGEQVRQLMELNQHLSEDAKNLTHALKGSSKTQGSWGELVLERVLEASGLRKGHEYLVQTSHTREDGSRAQPDVIIQLPEGRSLVVDSKVSLTAYEEFAVTDNEGDRTAAVRRHLESVRGHIKGLSEKNYQALYSLKSLDFVLLFVPIEPAFMLAVTSHRDLFMDAYHRNVLLVSPSTLLFVVRTVAHLWRQEAQSRNAQEIAKRGADLYDKFVGFVADMDSLGNRLKQAQSDFDDAYGKLTSGRGNLVSQAQKLRQLGVKPNKSLEPSLVEGAYESEELPFPIEDPMPRSTPALRKVGDLT